MKTDVFKININDDPNLSYTSTKSKGEIKKIEVILNDKILFIHDMSWKKCSICDGSGVIEQRRWYDGDICEVDCYNCNGNGEIKDDAF